MTDPIEREALPPVAAEPRDDAAPPLDGASAVARMTHEVDTDDMFAATDRPL